MEGRPADDLGCIRMRVILKSRAMSAGGALLDQDLGGRDSGANQWKLSRDAVIRCLHNPGSMVMRSLTLRGGWSRGRSDCPLVSSPDHALDALEAICDVSRLPLVRALAAASVGGRA